jgi:hypothetical protein
MPALPPSVLEAAKLKIDPDGEGRWRLPDTYRAFLSKRDGGRLRCGGFNLNGKRFVIGGFYAFADAANWAERLRKAGKLPDGVLPVAYSDDERPLIFVELTQRGKVKIKTAARARYDDKRVTHSLASDFGQFLNMLRDPKDMDSDGGDAPPVIDSPWGVPVAPKPKPKPKKKAKPKPAKKPAKKKAKKKAKPKPKKKTAKKKAAKKTAKKAKKKPAKKKAKKKKRR